MYRREGEKVVYDRLKAYDLIHKLPFRNLGYRI
jgi:hypothetical protein